MRKEQTSEEMNPGPELLDKLVKLTRIQKAIIKALKNNDVTKAINLELEQQEQFHVALGIMGKDL
jgi:hypothetical protein